MKQEIRRGFVVNRHRSYAYAYNVTTVVESLSSRSGGFIFNIFEDVVDTPEPVGYPFLFRVYLSLIHI